MANLKGMNVQALMSLRDQVDKRLLECRAELEKQLATLGGAKLLKGKASGNSLKAGKSHQNIEVGQARLGPEEARSLGGW